MPLPDYMREGAKKWYIEYCEEASRLFLALMTELDASEIQFNGALYAWEVETLAGTYRIHDYGDWIAGRFEDPAEGKKLVDCNPYSGKWNFHTFWNQQKKKNGAHTPEEFIDNFARQLRRILKQEGSHENNPRNTGT